MPDPTPPTTPEPPEPPGAPEPPLPPLPPRSRYDKIRRIAGPIALVGALALITRDACDRDRTDEATIVLDFGAAGATVRAVHAEIATRDDEPPAITYDRNLEGGGARTVSFRAVGAGTVSLRVDVTTTTGTRTIRRRVALEDRATITVPLEVDLGAPLPR